MANLTRLSVLIGDADAHRSREVAALLAGLGVRQVMRVDALAPLLLALKARAFDVLVCAEQLGGEDGVAVLRAALDVAPATRAVLMRHRERAGELVPEDIEAIELPLSRQTLQGLLHRTASPQGGLWCEVPELSLSDILQMYHQANRSITVLLSGPIAGRVRLEAGEIVDAEAGGERGMTALSRLLEAETGLVRTQPPRSDATRTISASFQSVLLEAAHKLDERRRDGQGSPMSGPPTTSPATASAASTSPTSGSSVPAISAPPGSLGSAAFRGGPSSRDLGHHDFITRELASISNEVQTLAPNLESFLVNGASRRRRTTRAAIAVLSSLVFLAVAALYFRNRLTMSAIEPAHPIAKGLSDEPIAAVTPEAPGALERQNAGDEVAGALAPSGEVPAEDGDGVGAPLPQAPGELEGSHEVARVPEAAPLAAADDSSFELRITSKPSRAWVLEEGRVLGKTPLTVTIAVSSVADAPREFLVRLPGFFPVRISRGASEANVSSSVVLEPRPAVVEAPDGGQLEYDPKATRPGNPRTRQKDLGIRLQR